MNLWHDIPLGNNVPEEINAIIEIPRGSSNKYEIDKDTGLIALDRANYSSAAYPFDYGFAPQTLWEDNDALDIIVMTTYPLAVGILVKVRPIGILEMTDDGESDSKVITVPVDDRRWEDVQSLDDLNKHTLKEYRHFLETYKALKVDGETKNPTEIHGYKGKDEAFAAIEKSIKLYKDKFGSK